MEWWFSGPVALMINSLVALSYNLVGSLGLTIIILTIIIRGAMYPLTVKQLRATKAMQDLQPKIAELQKKYAKDKQRLAQEQMKLYKESGMSPAGCGVPMLVQMPVWIALYQSIIRVIAVSPEDSLNLSRYLYSWPVVYSALPLSNNFLWISNLADPNIPLAILVGVTMWLQQKMVTPTSADPQQRAQSQMMLWVMPLMFGFLAMSFPSGLALYWLASNVISIVIQYFVAGWGGLATLVGSTTRRPATADKRYLKRIAEVEESPSRITALEADIVDPSSAAEEPTIRKEGYSSDINRIRHQRKSKGHHKR